MKKIILTMLTIFIAFACFFGCTKTEDKKDEQVVLTMGSWRADDVAAWETILAEYKKISGVEIQFKPTNPPDYNATLRLQLDNGTGPDLMFARSYATGAELFAKGFFEDVSDLPGLQENFSATAKAAWQDSTGKSFAVPVAAVIQSVFYNKNIFKQAGIAIPETWEDFLAACKSLAGTGRTAPLANGVSEEWDINECFMMGILPNFIDAEKGRLAYENGERPFNDADMVKAFQAMADVAQYCPKGFEALSYNDSNALFATGKAAMFADGSWTLDTFKDLPFEWGNFAFPPPKGKTPAICFHVDMGIAMNANGKHKEEAKAFLRWLCTPEGVAIVAKGLPGGFYPMIQADIKIEDPHSAELYSLIKGREQDVRFVWPKLMNGDPSGYVLMNQGVIAVMKGEKTAQQAADEMAAGLAKWYKPSK
ncbi:carbohydrate ABC transporter substrate-binding protein [Treponema phagedenis]|uniref:Probable sugar-binding periplasmic protein n=1 Tax=Treponema phagedenis TaxID=162 RepID=A0A0B7GUY2_TREPH|nr:ABC transporter substrate-binding protein [Treponema phagedenis]QEJ94209.1 carbohydrate ABC transporter substrate-binding protein [Treponema phagedenis]QEJ99205.1 carbohydrate ABC transporter substrate-binding protein [Treponema phagedenis]QEK00168.1 carbohydrate ABC transporter substrate-binding protein [Treponema phagedenis]QEK07662.1 carbohydrate ABC transporter substrate-binding protein [Treponema phagedenis]QSI00153.1 carbohydrate ABC transporter substrate-binding protein [Treponema ph